MINGALTDEPQKNFANASAANDVVEGFVRAAAIELGNGIRINAVSPTVIEDSPQYFPYFPSEIPITMCELEYSFHKSMFGAYRADHQTVMMLLSKPPVWQTYMGGLHIKCCNTGLKQDIYR